MSEGFQDFDHKPQEKKSYRRNYSKDHKDVDIGIDDSNEEDAVGQASPSKHKDSLAAPNHQSRVVQFAVADGHRTAASRERAAKASPDSETSGESSFSSSSSSPSNIESARKDPYSWRAAE